MDLYIRLLASETFEQSCARLGTADQGYFTPGVLDGRMFPQNDLQTVFSNRRFAKVREGFLALPKAERRACLVRETRLLFEVKQTGYARLADRGAGSYDPFSFYGNKMALTAWCWMAAEQGWADEVGEVLERQEAINRAALANANTPSRGWVNAVAAVEPAAELSCWVKVLRVLGGDGPGAADRLLEAAGPRILAEEVQWVGWRARVTPFDLVQWQDGEVVDRAYGYWQAWVYKWAAHERSDPVLREAVMAGFRTAALDAAGAEPLHRAVE